MGKNDGIEVALRKRGNVRSVVTLYPTPVSAAMEDPEVCADRLDVMIRARVANLERQFGEKPRVRLVGLSYGFCTALIMAMRTNFQDIFDLIGIEGPINPDVPVTPPLLIPPLLTCTKHYARRPELMREVHDYLQMSGMMDRVTVMRGSAHDDVVPLAAQIFPGEFSGRLVTFPPDIGNKREGWKSVFPDEYLNHLSWSDAKMAMACDVIERDEESATMAMSA